MQVEREKIEQELLNRWGFTREGGISVDNQLKIFSLMDWLDKSNEDTITLTKDDLLVFMDNVEKGLGTWSDTSYRICTFLGIDPTSGI